MTYQDITKIMQETGLPFSYYQFPEDSGQEPPFICFYYPESDDFQADNSNYVRIRALVVELYTDIKDFAIEAAVEDVLRAHELTFQKSESYIGSERMYQITYETEVLING